MWPDARWAMDNPVVDDSDGHLIMNREKLASVKRGKKWVKCVRERNLFFGSPGFALPRGYQAFKLQFSRISTL
jgi:hypothetical protein